MKGCGLPGLERCSSEQRLASARPCVTRKHRNIPQAPQKKDGSRLLELSTFSFYFYSFSLLRLKTVGGARPPPANQRKSFP